MLPHSQLTSLHHVLLSYRITLTPINVCVHDFSNTQASQFLECMNYRGISVLYPLTSYTHGHIVEINQNPSAYDTLNSNLHSDLSPVFWSFSHPFNTFKSTFGVLCFWLLHFLITPFFKSTYQFIPKLIYFSTQSGTIVNDLNSSPATQLPGIPLSTLYALNKVQTLHYMQNLCSFLLQLEFLALQRNILNNQVDVTTDSWLQLNS